MENLVFPLGQWLVQLLKKRNSNPCFNLSPWYVLFFLDSGLPWLSYCQCATVFLFLLQLSFIFSLICSLCTNCLSLSDMNKEYKCVMPKLQMLKRLNHTGSKSSLILFYNCRYSWGDEIIYSLKCKYASRNS